MRNTYVLPNRNMHTLVLISLLRRRVPYNLLQRRLEIGRLGSAQTDKPCLGSRAEAFRQLLEQEVLGGNVWAGNDEARREFAARWRELVSYLAGLELEYEVQETYVSALAACCKKEMTSSSVVRLASLRTYCGLFLAGAVIVATDRDQLSPGCRLPGQATLSRTGPSAGEQHRGSRHH